MVRFHIGTALILLFFISCSKVKREIKWGRIKPYEEKFSHLKNQILPECSCKEIPCTILTELENRDYRVSVTAFRKYLKIALNEQDSFLLNHLAHVHYGGGERYSTIRSVPEWDLSKPGAIELSIYIGSGGAGAYHFESNKRLHWFNKLNKKRLVSLSFYQKLYVVNPKSAAFAQLRDSLSQIPLKKVLFDQILTDRREWGK